MAETPKISAILAVQGRYELARRTIRHLRAQTVRGHMELILVAVSDQPLTVPPQEVDGFHSVQILQIPPESSVAQANAAGTRSASAMVVVFAEDHCFPAADWAASLLSAHARGYAAVGPEVANANPGNVVSWCDYAIGYGPWMRPCPAGEREFLPGHNSSYKRDILLGYGERLDAMLESETVLHFDLRSRGMQLYLEPKAKTAHVNFALWSVWLPVQYHGGRVFAGTRAASWGMGKRLFYGAASPLIPFVRAARVVQEFTRPGRPWQRLPTILPAVLIGLISDGLGQMNGYLTGVGKSAVLLANYEYDRLRFVRAEDKAALQSG